MNSIDSEKVRAGIKAAVRILNRSETGRATRKQLKAFLDGRISNLDMEGWEAVLGLLTVYNNGFPGSVLEALEE